MIILKIAAAREIEFCARSIYGGLYLERCLSSGDYAAGVTRGGPFPIDPPDYCEIEDCVVRGYGYYCYTQDLPCYEYYRESDYVYRYVRCDGQSIYTGVVNQERDAAGLDFCPNYREIWGDDGNGKLCIVHCSYTPYSHWGLWDGSEQKCVRCNDNRVEVSLLGDTSDIYCPSPYQNPGNQRCESACGASEFCDEFFPNSTHRDINNPELDILCTSTCLAFSCYGNACDSLEGRTCTYKWYYSPPPYPSFAIWEWVPSSGIDTSFEDGVPWNECFDNIDNDCDGDKDCADLGCKGVQNPNTGVRCCQSDSDCPPQNNTKGKCDTTGEITGTPYTCYWRPCKSDDECIPGTYCYCGVCSSTFTSAGCRSGYCCDRGYGGTGVGQCVSKGTIRNIGSVSYLCDPPEWNSGEENPEIKNESKARKNIFESILSFFYLFFQR